RPLSAVYLSSSVTAARAMVRPPLIVRARLSLRAAFVLPFNVVVFPPCAIRSALPTVARQENAAGALLREPMAAPSAAFQEFPSPFFARLPATRPGAAPGAVTRRCAERCLKRRAKWLGSEKPLTTRSRRRRRSRVRAPHAK